MALKTARLKMVVKMPAFKTLKKVSGYIEVLLETIVCLLWHHSP
jgi:hypothetical protein